MRRYWTTLLLSGMWVVAPTAYAATVHIVNLHGGIHIHTDAETGFHVQHTVKGRPGDASDVTVRRTPTQIYIESNPSDNAEIDVDVSVPYRVPVIAQTGTGAISIDGFFPSADLYTDSGDLHLEVPWEATKLGMQSTDEPKEFITPKGIKFTTRTDRAGDYQRWIAVDRLENDHFYGGVRVTAKKPGKVELVSIPIPAESPVKLHWQAPEILDDILNGKQTAGPTRGPEMARNDAGASSGDFLIRSEVRIVNLQVAAFDEEGSPLTGLGPSDFEVIENGVPQDVKVAVSEEAPFNLVLLLDLSGSTRSDRDAMKEAAARFVGIARPQDKVALYVLGNDEFHVLSSLTKDHESVLEQVRALPRVAGSSPVYDTIVLAYAQELRQHPGERNALIVITDGIDNQIHQAGTPSDVSFKKLLKAADSMDVLIYPIFLDPYTEAPAPGWAKKALEQLDKLATATGGRLFPAKSLEDLDPVYPQVAEELRSLYSVAYYPKNQEFNGEWRKIQVVVKRENSKVRARQGYYAR